MSYPVSNNLSMGSVSLSAGVVPNSDPCQIFTPVVLLGLWLGVGKGSDFNESKMGTKPVMQCCQVLLQKNK